MDLHPVLWPAFPLCAFISFYGPLLRSMCLHLRLWAFILIYGPLFFSMNRYCVLWAVIPFYGPASCSIACISAMSRCYVLCAIILVYEPSIYVLCSFFLIYVPLILSMCLHLVLCTVHTIQYDIIYLNIILT